MILKLSTYNFLGRRWMECTHMGCDRRNFQVWNCLDWTFRGLGTLLDHDGAHTLTLFNQKIAGKSRAVNEKDKIVSNLPIACVPAGMRYSPSWTSSCRWRPRSGTLGYNRSESLIAHSKYFISFKSFMVGGRVRSPSNIESSSSTTLSWMSGLLPNKNRVQQIEADVVSWPSNLFVLLKKTV